MLFLYSNTRPNRSHWREIAISLSIYGRRKGSPQYIFSHLNVTLGDLTNVHQVLGKLETATRMTENLLNNLNARITEIIDYTILDWTLEIGSFASTSYGGFLEKSNKILRIKIGTSNKKQTLESDGKNMFMSNKNKLVNIRHRWATIIKS